VRSVFRTAFMLCAVVVFAGVARAEDVLTDARALATSGHRPEALRMLADRLTESPGDPDARLLCGLILSWEGRYDEARQQLEYVLSTHPDYTDAIQALINVEMWSDHPDRAEKIAAEALTRKQQNTTLLLAQARALRAQNREREALDVVHRLLAIDPSDRQALSTERSLRESISQWRVSWSHTYDWFKGGGGAWNETQMSLKRATPLGSVIATFSRARRFGDHSNIAEVSFYPHIRKGTYGYVGFGYSYDATLYPRRRIGAEIFQSLPHGFEVSGGYRGFSFSDITNMYTGSLGKYKGNWLFTARFFLTPDALGETHSVSGTARRFIGSSGDYIGFHVGTGPSPFDPRSRQDLETLKASSGYVEFKKSLAGRWVFSGLAGLAIEQRFRDVTINHYTLEGTFGYRF
jgi:YaiO family outer membrane protein